jgi:uncharacterized GH25 family protein
MNRFIIRLAAGLLCGWNSLATAHDTWVEVNTPVIRFGDVIHTDLRLGNHGNDHRDFKLHSRVNLDKCTFEVVAPSGSVTDLKPKAVATAMEEKQGYWTARHVPTEPGLHVVTHQLDSQHGTTRTVKNARTYFLAGSVGDSSGWDSQQAMSNQGLTISPLENPIAMAAAGQPLKVQLMFEGKPLAAARVAFIPRGQQLKGEMDPEFERNTDTMGIAEFTPAEGNIVLIVAHHMMADRKGEGYEKTQYAATLTIAVPQIPYKFP